jgi:flagellar hook-basal body complex protein FliE
MSGMEINGVRAGAELQQASGKKKPSEGFDDLMQEAVGKLSQVQNDTENAVKELTSGGDVTHALVAMEKADMSFSLMVEVRNKLLSAYEELMRMQV